MGYGSPRNIFHPSRITVAIFLEAFFVYEVFAQLHALVAVVFVHAEYLGIASALALRTLVGWLDLGRGPLVHLIVSQQAKCVITSQLIFRRIFTGKPRTYLQRTV